MHPSSRQGSAPAFKSQRTQTSPPSSSHPTFNTSHPTAKSAGSGIIQRPRLHRSPHSEPSKGLSARRSATRDDTRKIPPSLVLRQTTAPRDSITEDPFFRQYDNPQSARLARDLRKQIAHISLDEDEAATDPQQAHIEAPVTFTARKANIGVVGASGCGKTSYIRMAMELDENSNHPSRSSKIVDANGQKVAVRMFEYLPDELQVDANGEVRWPADTQGTMGKHIDGAVILCDITDARSFRPVESIMATLSAASIPTLIAIAKCDVPRQFWQIDPMAVRQQLRQNHGAIFSSISAGVPEAAQQSLASLVTSIGVSRTSQSDVPRPRALTTRPRRMSTSPAPSHARAASDYSLSSKNSFPLGDLSFLAYSLHPKQTFFDSSRSSLQNINYTTPQANMSADQTRPKVSVDTSLPTLAKSQSDCRSVMSANPRRLSSGSEESDNSLSLAHSTDNPSDQIVCSFEELAERLLAEPRSKADTEFQSIFLSLYRLFAPPLKLLSFIVSSYHRTMDGSGFSLATESVLGRHLSVINQWLSAYPGDFGAGQTRERLKSFLASPVHFKEHDPVIEQLQMALKLVVDDDDTEWAFSDEDAKRPTTAQTTTSTSTTDDMIDMKSFLHSSPTSPETSFSSNTSPTKRHATRPSTAATPSDFDASIIFRSRSTVALTAIGPNMTSAYANAINISGSAARQAALLIPHPTIPLNKAHWRELMEIPDEHIAQEMTRIDWIMFSSIRLRDIVRHVTIPKHEQAKFPSLANVERLVQHFNHLAHWVASMVLLRDKPKHRAQALEKLMRIGRHLRSLNNYNSLGALVAGIHGSAVHRLAATKDLIPVQLQRDFMKLEILMGTSKGSAAYRLAWENTTGERVPFLPMVRKDLITVFAANKTFAPTKDQDVWAKSSRKVNWNKFQIMGEILNSVQRAQAEPYSGFATHEDVRSLLLDTVIIKDDDELHARSVQLEPNGGSGVSVDVIGLGRRRLTGWLNRTA